MEKQQQLGIVIGLVVVGFVIMYFVTRKEVVEAEGDQKCIGNDLYIYQGGQWILEETNSLVCTSPPEPEPEPEPGPLPPGFEIDYIGAEPPVVILGNSVSIKVNYFCPNPKLEERTYTLQCVIDGITLQHTSTSATIRFEYTPTRIGPYNATIQGDGISKFNCPSSVSFEVKEEAVGVFYSPFGSYTAYATLSALAEHIASLKVGSTSSTSRPWKTVDLEWAGRHYTHGVVCPYCDEVFVAEPNALRRGSTFGAKTAAAYKLLLHIQSSHPANPLTKPRCHIEVSVPQPLGLPSANCYAVRIDNWMGARGLTYWRAVGWTNLGRVMVTYEYQASRNFVSILGNHHVEIRGPMPYTLGMEWRGTNAPYEYPSIFDQDITLMNLGDRASFDVETGIEEIVEWKW